MLSEVFERLRHAYEADIVLLKQIDEAHEIGKRPAEPINLVNHDNVDAAGLHVPE